jgi:hypothetical protein
MDTPVLTVLGPLAIVRTVASDHDLRMLPMSRLTDFTRYDDAQTQCTSAALWALFDGDREHFNITHECIDRHVEGDRTAVIVAHAEGHDEILSYATLSRDAARFAHGLHPGGDSIRLTTGLCNQRANNGWVLVTELQQSPDQPVQLIV